MGFRISYIVATMRPRDLVAPLGFRLGVETDALPYDEWWTGTMKSNGQTVFWSEAEEFVADVANDLMTMSQVSDVVACRVDEDGQTSSAVCYANGHVKWQITATADAEELIATGDLPAEYGQVLKDFADQPFAVPLETAAAVSGFNHEIDMTNSAFRQFFRIMAATDAPATPAPKRGFFAKFLGR